MKERLNIRDAFFVLTSRLSPLGTVRIKPPKGSIVAVEKVLDSKAPSSESATIDEIGRVVVPEGSSARVTIKQGDSETQLRVEDYRGRTGHTPGARIIGNGVDINLDLKERKKFVPEIGYISYRK